MSAPSPSSGVEVLPGPTGAPRGDAPRSHHDVFVCYASEDKAVADAVVATLEQGGVRCWIAPRDVTPGEPWAVDILRGIRGATVVVFVLSSHSNASPHVSRELERAVSEGLAVLPLRIEDVLPSAEIEYYISSAHWLDAMTPPLRAHLARLLETVRFLVAERRPAVEAGVTAPAPAGSPPIGPSTAGRRTDVVVRVLAVVAVVLLVVAAALAVAKVRSGEISGPSTSTSTSSSATSTSTAAGTRQVRIADIKVGDCFDLPPESAAMAYVILVDCAGDHDVTFYAELQYPSYAGQAFPGTDALNDYARSTCDVDFARIFTDPALRSRLINQPIIPNDTSWEDGDRTIQCLAWEPGALSGSNTTTP